MGEREREKVEKVIVALERYRGFPTIPGTASSSTITTTTPAVATATTVTPMTTTTTTAENSMSTQEV